MFKDILEHNSKIENNLKKSQDITLDAAVAIIIRDGEVLLGLADTDDDRNDKWCFPGGGIDENESCLNASIREAYEEMGVVAKPVMSMFFIHPIKPKVGFCLLTTETKEIIMNDEFTDYDWFDINQLPKETLSVNKDILEFVKNINIK